MVIVVKFWNDGCMPCKSMSDFLRNEKIEHENVNLTQDEATFEKFAVMNVPTVIIFDNDGNELHRVVGFNSSKLSEIKEAIKIGNEQKEEKKPKWEKKKVNTE